MRVAYNGVEDLKRLMPDLTEEELANTDFGVYGDEQFYDDLCRVTQYRTDPKLAEALVTRSLDTMLWMRAKGIRFAPIYGRQASRSRAGSSSGAGSQSKHGAAGRDSSMRITRSPNATESTCATRAARSN